MSVEYIDLKNIMANSGKFRNDKSYTLLLKKWYEEKLINIGSDFSELIKTIIFILQNREKN